MVQQSIKRHGAEVCGAGDWRPEGRESKYEPVPGDLSRGDGNHGSHHAVRDFDTRDKDVMISKEDLESFLDRLSADGATYSVAGENTWVVHPGGALEVDVVVHFNPPVVVLRVKVMNIPSANGRSAELNRRLLELNATDLVHGSYGISDGAIVLTEALELSHLEFEEFLASYEGMTLALATHLRELATYREDA